MRNNGDRIGTGHRAGMPKHIPEQDSEAILFHFSTLRFRPSPPAPPNPPKNKDTKTSRTEHCSMAAASKAGSFPSLFNIPKSAKLERL